LADVLELGPQTTVLRCESSQPSTVAALALRTTDRLRVLIANLTPAPVSAVVQPTRATEFAVRMLDETTAREALADPLTYRERPSVTRLTDSGAPLELAPFAVARLDGHAPAP
jgi:hypothetical protein